MISGAGEHRMPAGVSGSDGRGTVGTDAPATETGRPLICGHLGSDFRVDMDVLAERLDAIDDGRVISSRASYVVASLRLIAADIESELLGLRDLRDGASKLEDGEAQFFEGPIPEFGQLGIVHDAGRRVGVIRRVLGMLLGGAGRKVSSAHGSPSIDARGAESRSASDPIVGDAPGAPATPAVDAPGAPSEAEQRHGIRDAFVQEIGEDHPNALSRLDRRDGVGSGR